MPPSSHPTPPASTRARARTRTPPPSRRGQANVLFCRPGTAVIELGFRSPAAGHYRHAALALGLHYEWVGLEADEHAMGQAFVRVDGGLDAARDAVLGGVRRWLGRAAAVGATAASSERRAEL